MQEILNSIQQVKNKAGKYVCFILLGLMVCFIVCRTYYIRGRVDCEQKQVAIVRQTDNKIRCVQAEVARVANTTATVDIRRLLREKYTIAD